MTVIESLIAINTYPIPTNAVDKAALDRGLTGSEEYTAIIGLSEAYRLVQADLYMWLYSQPSITEQEVSIKQEAKIKEGLLGMANAIYFEFDDPKYTGKGTYGFVGESYNG